MAITQQEDLLLTEQEKAALGGSPVIQPVVSPDEEEDEDLKDNPVTKVYQTQIDLLQDPTTPPEVRDTAAGALRELTKVSQSSIAGIDKTIKALSDKLSTMPEAQGEAVQFLKNKYDEIQSTMDENTSKTEMREALSLIANGLIQAFAGAEGMRKGVNIAGMQLYTPDWDKRYQRILDKAKLQTGQAETSAANMVKEDEKRLAARKNLTDKITGLEEKKSDVATTIGVKAADIAQKGAQDVQDAQMDVYKEQNKLAEKRADLTISSAKAAQDQSNKDRDYQLDVDKADADKFMDTAKLGMMDKKLEQSAAKIKQDELDSANRDYVARGNLKVKEGELLLNQLSNEDRFKLNNDKLALEKQIADNRNIMSQEELKVAQGRLKVLQDTLEWDKNKPSSTSLRMSERSVKELARLEAEKSKLAEKSKMAFEKKKDAISKDIDSIYKELYTDDSSTITKEQAAERIIGKLIGHGVPRKTAEEAVAFDAGMIHWFDDIAGPNDVMDKVTGFLNSNSPGAVAINSALSIPDAIKNIPDESTRNKFQQGFDAANNLEDKERAARILQGMQIKLQTEGYMK